ncbi:MAG TPA: carbohydrate-binding family 9-like protein [Candidatus Acidoferrum sp.]
MLAWRFRRVGGCERSGAQKVRTRLGTRFAVLGLSFWVVAVAAGTLSGQEMGLLRESRVGHLNMSEQNSDSDLSAQNAATADTAVATALRGAPDGEGFPAAEAWDRAVPVQFSADWQGKHADADRATEVRLLWTPSMLYLKFVARYKVITVFSDAGANGRRDKLWDRDVAEVFLQPEPSAARRYKEFEVSPNGFWIDLDIDLDAKGDLKDLHSGLRRRVKIDEQAKTWTAEVAIPMKSLVAHFDAAATWRANFYRIEGDSEPRFYSAWRATNTEKPNFHVPERFGYLKFASAER